MRFDSEPPSGPLQDDGLRLHPVLVARIRDRAGVNAERIASPRALLAVLHRADALGIGAPWDAPGTGVGGSGRTATRSRVLATLAHQAFLYDGVPDLDQWTAACVRRALLGCRDGGPAAVHDGRVESAREHRLRRRLVDPSDRVGWLGFRVEQREPRSGRGRRPG